MLFRRKKNQRREDRGHVLDVKLRSRQIRSARVKTFTTTVSLSLATLTALFLLWRGGEWALDRFVFKNPTFNIQTVEAETDGTLSLDQIRQWSGVRIGDNLLALDLVRIKRDLELAPIIESASVERILPHSLRIRVVEREPIAQIRQFKPSPDGTGISAVFCFLDGAGYFILPHEEPGKNPGPSEAGLLPQLTGLPALTARPGAVIRSPKVHAALALIREFERSPLFGSITIVRIDLAAPQVLRVTTDQGSELIFGPTRLEDQMRRWRQVHDHAAAIGKTILALDLSITNNLPARWGDAAALPAPMLKRPKPVRSKKNV